jgi:Glyoxalase-like domain
MSVSVQVTFDAHDPEALGRFWAEVLGYIEQPPPEGFDSWDDFLESISFPVEERGDFYAVVDPEKNGPRLFFQRVPEGKTAKNRLHLDVNVGTGAKNSDERRAIVRTRADALVALGATETREVEERGEYWIVLQDPEGNEFCLQ